MFVEPLAGWRDVRVSSRRTALDWARQIKSLVDDPRYRRAIRIMMVCDNLNTHKLSSLYQQTTPASSYINSTHKY
jgi:thiamine biosynthesis protein ThiC